MNRTRSGKSQRASCRAGTETNIEARKQDISPLEVMLETMRFYHSGVDRLIMKLFNHAEDLVDPNAVLEAIRELLSLRELALKAAVAAAPYVHPRIKSVNAADHSRDFIPLEERLAYYEGKGPDPFTRNKMN